MIECSKVIFTHQRQFASSGEKRQVLSSPAVGDLHAAYAHRSFCHTRRSRETMRNHGRSGWAGDSI